MIAMTIHAPAGTRAIPMMAIGNPDHEREVLLDRPGRYRIRSVEPTTAGGHHVVADYLPDAPPPRPPA